MRKGTWQRSRPTLGQEKRLVLAITQSLQDYNLSWHKLLKLMAALDFTILSDFCFSPQLQYTAAAKENLPNYNLVTDTPVHVTALQSYINASEVRLSCFLFQNKPFMSLCIFKQQKRITHVLFFCPQVKYKENYHQTKDKYTTVLETVDYDRTKSLKDLYSSVSCLFCVFFLSVAFELSFFFPFRNSMKTIGIGTVSPNVCPVFFPDLPIPTLSHKSSQLQLNKPQFECCTISHNRHKFSNVFRIAGGFHGSYSC